MGTLFVCGGLVVALAALCWWQERRAEARKPDDSRETWNAYALHLWLDGKPGFYPHELPCGTVRWYRVVHDEMDNGCPAAN